MRRNWFNFKTPFKKPLRSYLPWYDDSADYNTNAKSYYDYLARLTKYLGIVEQFINRLLDRDLKVEDTYSIDLTKNGDWLDNGECEPDNYDDIITLKADVIISDETENRTLVHTTQKNFTIPNGTTVKTSGVWSPDYMGLIQALDDEIGFIYQQLDDLQTQINEIVKDINQINQQLQTINQTLSNHENRIENLEDETAILRRGLQQIVNNLYDSGAITSNNINTFTFRSGRDIATGNINLFGGTPDGNSFIRTNNGSTQNDITAGI